MIIRIFHDILSKVVLVSDMKNISHIAAEKVSSFLTHYQPGRIYSQFLSHLLPSCD